MPPKPRHHRPTIAALAVVTLITLVGPAAGAQTKGQVDEAGRAAESARRDLVDAVDSRDDAGRHLALALADYEQANTELERLAFATADLEARLVAHEGRTRELRRRVEHLVVAAYITGSPDPAAGAFDVAPGPERVMVEQVAAARSARVGAEIDDLAAALDTLRTLRAEYGLDRESEARLRAEISERTAVLDELFAATDGRVELAVAAVAGADRAYQAALTRYEEEQRRLQALGGVLRWRPLVEQYFPPERVGEALRVMHCESRGNPDARHPASDASGLFQFLAGTWAFASPRAGFAGASRFDPAANVASAAWLLDYSIRTNHPWGPWGRWSCRSAVPHSR